MKDSANLCSKLLFIYVVRNNILPSFPFKGTVCKDSGGRECTLKLNDSMCYIREIPSSSGTIVLQGCTDKTISVGGVDTLCGSDMVMCCSTDYCNSRSNMSLMNVIAPTSCDVEKYVTPAVVLVVCLTVLVISIPLWFVMRKKCRGFRRRVPGNNRRSPIELLTSGVPATPMSSGSGLTQLSQRTVAQTIRLGGLIGSGRFGQVFVGKYQSEKVAVKKFSTRDELSWCRESEVYNMVPLRHENILIFFASDMVSHDGATEFWIITQFHPHGSLYDYLNLLTVSPVIMLRMSISICRGLTYLHTAVHGVSAKPAIAHRDVKSKNVLVKDNLECCIADFDLSIIQGAVSNLKFPVSSKQGSKRYMAPEILEGRINLSSFESFLHADVYALGLVLWELCSRCQEEISEWKCIFC